MSEERNAPEDLVLLRLAEAIADRGPVDWLQADESDPVRTDELRALQVIDRGGHAHRGSSEDFAEREASRARAESDRTPRNSAVAENAPPARWGNLRLLQKIGGGGYGDVYRAHDPALQRTVALKILHLRDEPFERGGRFLEEARRLARVRHPNVLVVHGAEEHQGRVGLWTDLVEGQTLKQLLSEQGLLGATEATTIGIDLCRALAAVHAAGLIHGDVKATNVMRERGGRIILMDFSSVHEWIPSDVESTPPCGTPLYMAPEVFLGARLSPRTDIYALGVLLYHLVSGRYPVEAHDLRELVQEHARVRSVPLRDVRSDLPASFIQTVERAQERDPDQRYASVGELERGLAASLGLTYKPSADATRIKLWRRAWFQTAAVAVIALGLYLVLGPFLWPPAFRVDASLFRAADGKEERLFGGAAVSPGDDLFLEIEGSKRMYVYVLNEDDRGDSFVLFPLPNLIPQNPISPGVSHRLPGRLDGIDRFWEVSTSGGTETILIVASPNPLPEVERFSQNLRLASQAVSIDPNGEPSRALRGIGGLSEKSQGGPTSSALARIREALTGVERENLWVWQVQLIHRGE